jgi:lysophospholipase L1-like esterase
MKFPMSPPLVLLVALLVSPLSGQESKQGNALADAFFNAKKVVFLGDSITNHGEFIAVLESIILGNEKDAPQLLNLGLGSETCSGDSEPAHPWPRPNVHERFERVLEKVEPDLIVVNYGMNDGIYHPFDKDRFERYQAGINKIIDAAENSDGKLKVILVTPPPFDPLPVRKKGNLVLKDAKEFLWTKVYENYDTEVIAVYSEWILKQRDRVAGCIDLRTPILNDLAKRRESDPDFHYAHDGVHVNSEGHRIIGESIASALGLDATKHCGQDIVDVIKVRNSILRDSWLFAVGHKRPNVKAGLPLQKAVKRVESLDRTIEKIRKNYLELKKIRNENSNH